MDVNDSPRQKRAHLWAWVYQAVFGTDETAADQPTDSGDADEEPPADR